MRRSKVVATLAAAVLVATGMPAASAKTAWPDSVHTRAESLHPEGIAWDPSRRAFLVTSIRHGTVSVVDRDGDVTTLIDDARMHSTFGVHVDAVRGRILVAYADMGQDADPESGPAGVGVFELATGRPIRLVDVDPDSGDHVVNDVVTDWRGNVYATDSASDRVYRVTPDGRWSVFAQDPRFDAGDGVGINGIVWHPRGFLIAGHYGSGNLYRIDVHDPSRVRRVRLSTPLVGADGLALRRNGSLVVVTNGLGADGEDAVTVLRGRGHWTSARVQSEHTPWPVKEPTTVATSPYGDYVVSGQLGILLGGGTSDELALQRRTRR